MAFSKITGKSIADDSIALDDSDAVLSTGNSAPANPFIGQRWFKSNTGVTYQRVVNPDGVNPFWLDISSAGIGTSTNRGIDFVGDVDPHIKTNGTGLAVGSTYYNREQNRHFTCTNATTDANVWVGDFEGGGTITSYLSGSTVYRIHTFLSSGTFINDTSRSVDVLVIGGGGGPSFGGGGAGALSWDTARSISVGTYAVTVGNGGVRLSNGQDSIFGANLVKAVGGGRGGGPSSNPGDGTAGGSGGGGGHNGGGGNRLAGVGTATGSIVSGNGSVHIGTGSPGGEYWGGGGGGAGGVIPATGSNNVGGVGGAGDSTFVGNATTTAALLYAAKAGTNSANIPTGTLSSNPGTLYIAAGGAGAYGHHVGGAGGGGIGSPAGAGDFLDAGSGLAGTGSGAGGNNGISARFPHSGGSGIVIIRYALT